MFMKLLTMTDGKIPYTQIAIGIILGAIGMLIYAKICKPKFLNEDFSVLGLPSLPSFPNSTSQPVLVSKETIIPKEKAVLVEKLPLNVITSAPQLPTLINENIEDDDLEQDDDDDESREESDNDDDKSEEYVIQNSGLSKLEEI